MKSSVRYLNGYRLLYLPDHISAMSNENWKGYVYEHIVVVEECLGRKIRSDEVVHHLDGNRSNNRKRNLIVILRSQHIKLHDWLNGAAVLETDGRIGVNSEKPKSTEPSYCECGRTLQDKQKFSCSKSCNALKRRRTTRPTKEELAIGISSKSWCELGREYGVSDNAVRKWARQYKLIG